MTMSNQCKNSRYLLPVAVLVTAPLWLSGCMMVGPDYVRPPAPTAETWLDPGVPAIRREPADLSAWWTVFNDPVLGALVETAYRQNPSLRAAGVRVLEAQARRGIAIGLLFPQQQETFGSATSNQLSKNRANRQFLPTDEYDDWQVGFDASWELDLWGRFRRGIEAADAELLASVASYDDVLVTLISEVARNYTLLRTLEERLVVARANVEIQQRSFEIADAKFKGGTVTELDSAQAAALLHDTEAQVPLLESDIQQTQNTLCILLGLPPQDLQLLLGGLQVIPTVPPEVAVGIPADLLRRRPDIRRSERQLAAQSAQIGIAKADLFPRFALLGTISVAARDFNDLFKSGSLENFGGPSFRWAIFNYGRIQNNIRVQDASYQALVGDYENTVLQAQGEVENAIAAYLGAQRQVQYLTGSVAAANRAVELAEYQYREGTTDYTRVLNTQQSLVVEQDRLVATRGEVVLNLVAVYKALGGGWELRNGKDFVAQETQQQMLERTYWDGVLTTEG
ncbi:MAG TPA: efflux transporter outer membrane subunit, partial [Candidatus Binatia bacterium]|nr:efflux transporter outer membrane subunit [Candidatus Binatia bacterium]